MGIMVYAYYGSCRIYFINSIKEPAGTLLMVIQAVALIMKAPEQQMPDLSFAGLSAMARTSPAL